MSTNNGSDDDKAAPIVKDDDDSVDDLDEDSPLLSDGQRLVVSLKVLNRSIFALRFAIFANAINQ